MKKCLTRTKFWKRANKTLPLIVRLEMFECRDRFVRALKESVKNGTIDKGVVVKQRLSIVNKTFILRYDKKTKINEEMSPTQAKKI